MRYAIATLAFVLLLVVPNAARAQRSVPTTNQNTPGDPVVVEQNPATPINVGEVVSLSQDIFSNIGTNVYTVPADSRFVVETISFGTTGLTGSGGADCAFFWTASSEYRVDPSLPIRLDKPSAPS